MPGPTPPSTPEPRTTDLLTPAVHRLVRAVDAMTDAQWAEPSRLPGWTRGHVVAHVTLNAEGLAAALDGVHEGVPVPMYPSQESRDADIAALGAAPPGEVRDRFLASSTRIQERIDGLAPNLADIDFPRVTGSTATVRAGDVAAMRLREVEIHHVDLGLGYQVADWSPDFAVLLLGARAAMYQGPPFTAAAADVDRRWAFGSGESTHAATVSGAVRDLAWWSTGRGSGEGLSSDDGTMPQIGAW